MEYIRPIIAITGGLASGKSTLTSLFEEIGKCQVISADRIAREIIEPGQEAYKALVMKFGDKILEPNKRESSDGHYTKEDLNSLFKRLKEGDNETVFLHELPHIDRAKLRKMVFGNDPETHQNRQFLESVTHPQIVEKSIELFKNTDKEYILWDVPLLVEKQLYHYADEVIVVQSDRLTQVQRALDRDHKVSLKTVTDIIEAQASDSARCEVANYIIMNDHKVSKDSLREKAEKINKMIMEGIVLRNKRLYFRRKKVNQNGADQNISTTTELLKFFESSKAAHRNSKKIAPIDKNKSFEEELQDSIYRVYFEEGQYSSLKIKKRRSKADKAE